jgi:hypothetical protein
MIRDEHGDWRNVPAGYCEIVGRVDADGWIAWER